MDKLIKSQLLYQLSYGGLIEMQHPLTGEPLVRFELTTHALRMRCSTTELQRQHRVRGRVNHISVPMASQIFSSA